MSKQDPLFIGWSADMPRVDRRFMLGLGAGLVGLGAGAGALIARAHEGDAGGRWDMGDVRDFSGLLLSEPYPLLRTLELDGTPRTAFLSTSGKSAVRLPQGLAPGPVRVRASLIARDSHAMLALVDDERAIARIEGEPAAALIDWPEQSLGEVMRVGEILDAKCWFGAMRPGFGRTHKACAALCARGGLPLAFCAGDVCTEGGEAPLFLDAAGRAHGRAILPLVADPVLVRGRLVRVGDCVQWRAAPTDIRRL